MEIELSMIKSELGQLDWMANGRLRDLVGLDFDFDMPASKSNEKAKSLREEGNRIFCKRQHTGQEHARIQRLYTFCIGRALPGSKELGLGYANRSAFLSHLGKHEECMRDVERALGLPGTPSIRVKLLCRKIKSLCALGQDEQVQRISYEKAKYWFNRLDDKEKEVLAKWMKKTEEMLEENGEISIEIKKKRKKFKIECRNDAFKINYNEKYGKHLVATRNIKPGEFVCMEEFQITMTNNHKAHVYCSHCLAVSWDLIPCDHCSVYFYCSENCKLVAWQKYHDIECFTTYEAFLMNDPMLSMSVRAFIMFYKEAGSLENLKSLFKNSKTSKKISEYPEVDKFFNISLKDLLITHNNNDCNKQFVKVAIKGMFILIRHQSQFGKDLTLDINSKIKDNQNVIFIACLFLRLITFLVRNAFNVPKLFCMCKYNESILSHIQRLRCARGIGFSPIASLINHSCDNNVSKFYTNDGKVVYYAIQPIKINSQIFSSYYCDYMTRLKLERQIFLYEMYGFECDCSACSKDWETIEQIQQHKYQNIQARDVALIRKYQHLMCTEQNKNYRYSDNTIKNYLQDFSKIFKNTNKPAGVLQMFVLMLMRLIEGRFGTNFRVPKKCKAEII